MSENGDGRVGVGGLGSFGDRSSSEREILEEDFQVG